MILNFYCKNFKAFDNEINVSFTADGQIKRFLCNTVVKNNRRVLKTVGIYGPNNTGKTCLILAIANLRNVMLNDYHEELSNLFIENNVTCFKVDYEIDKRIYTYEVEYDSKEKVYLREALYLNSVAESNNNVVSKKLLIKREKDSITIPEILNKNNKGFSIFSISGASPIVMTFNFDYSITPKLYQAKSDYIGFAKSIVLVRNDFQNIDLQKTINLLNTDLKARTFISEFIKNCDLHISDFGYDNNIESDLDINSYISNVVNKESLKFYSIHKNHRVPSFVFDSLGTQKIIALSGFIYSALKNNEILLIDEIDGSLHHILTKAIISLFNNELNNGSQLIFTTHDLLLLDIEKLFRKDQIYLNNVNNDGQITINSLNISSREENGIRGNEDVVKYYLQGRFGSIPSPELFDVLEEISSDN